MPSITSVDEYYAMSEYKINLEQVVRGGIDKIDDSGQGWLTVSWTCIRYDCCWGRVETRDFNTCMDFLFARCFKGHCWTRFAGFCESLCPFITFVPELYIIDILKGKGNYKPVTKRYCPLTGFFFSVAKEGAWIDSVKICQKKSQRSSLCLTR